MNWIRITKELPKPEVPVLVETTNGKYFVTSRTKVILGGKYWNGDYAFRGSSAAVHSIKAWTYITPSNI